MGQDLATAWKVGISPRRRVFNRPLRVSIWKRVRVANNPISFVKKMGRVEIE